MNLKSKSIEIILDNQHETGSYMACPKFETYKYCWLRDGSFIAWSMDLAGQTGSADRFFEWVDRVVSDKSGQVSRLIEMQANREEIHPSGMLPTRYNMDGSDSETEWPNFQLDGYGTWLWALCKHIEITGNKGLVEKYSKSIKTTLDYLLNFWQTPCYDCWEENGDKIHTSTLACIYGGLSAISDYVADVRINEAVYKIKICVLENSSNDRLVKYAGTDSVDASLLWAALPFGLFSINDTVMVNTVSQIERKLLHQCGVHRYYEDTYYGGGEWLLLSAWLGWYHCKAGNMDKAEALLSWVENQAGPGGEMPEQILTHVNNETYVQQWKDIWGEVASPLLWSHAMYLVLLLEMQKKDLLK